MVMFMQMGQTALMCAAEKNDEGIFNLLIEHGADVSIKSKVSIISEIVD